MLMLKLSAAPNGSAKGDREPDRAQLVQITQGVLSELRNLSTGLSLPEIDRVPLREALQLAASRHEDVTGARVTLMIENLPQEIPHALKICAYRVVQEALSNSYKHAGCIDPEVSVFVDNKDLLIIVADDGTGFDPEDVPEEGRRKLGLAGIRNRVRAFRGTLEIASLSGEGTQIIVRLPLQS
jgi:signal transduction histidine kinase